MAAPVAASNPRSHKALSSSWVCTPSGIHLHANIACNTGVSPDRQASCRAELVNQSFPAIDAAQKPVGLATAFVATIFTTALQAQELPDI